MSTLSKVFVVLVLLAAVVFAMTTLARLTTTEDYKQKFETEKQAKEAAVTAQETAEAKLGAEERAHNETRKTLGSRITGKDGEIASLKTAKKLVVDELNNLKTSLEKITADLASVEKELKEFHENNERLRKELDLATKRSAEDRTARLDAEHLLKDSQQRVNNLKQDAKNKETQILDLIKETNRLDNAIRTYLKMTGIDILRERPEEVDITGVVTDVRREGVDTYIGLSVGSTSDVKIGTKFIIYGEGTYKGDMMITKVYPDSSFGRLTAAGNRDVAKGDTAKTRLKPSL